MNDDTRGWCGIAVYTVVMLIIMFGAVGIMLSKAGG